MDALVFFSRFLSIFWIPQLFAAFIGYVFCRVFAGLSLSLFSLYLPDLLGLRLFVIVFIYFFGIPDSCFVLKLCFFRARSTDFFNFFTIFCFPTSFLFSRVCIILMQWSLLKGNQKLELFNDIPQVGTQIWRQSPGSPNFGPPNSKNRFLISFTPFSLNFHSPYPSRFFGPFFKSGGHSPSLDAQFLVCSL